MGCASGTRRALPLDQLIRPLSKFSISYWTRGRPIFRVITHLASRATVYTVAVTTSELTGHHVATTSLNSSQRLSTGKFLLKITFSKHQWMNDIWMFEGVPWRADNGSGQWVMGHGSVGHGSWVKWVNKSWWVTFVTGHKMWLNVSSAGCLVLFRFLKKYVILNLIF